MSATPLEIPEGYQINAAERGYIQKFEELKRKGIAMTPSDFYKQVKKSESTFARYRVLKVLLNEYGWQTKPDKMRGTPPSLLQKINVGPDPQVEALEDEIIRLKQRLAEVGALREAVVERDAEIKVLRTALMATISHFSSASMSRARGIEKKLYELYKTILPEKVLIPFVGDFGTPDRNFDGRK